MRFPRFVGPHVLAAVLTLSAAGGAEAATGSGTISFSFTGFSGPFAAANEALIGDPAQWQLTGTVNGVIPTLNGVTSPAFPGSVYIGGTTPLSGQSVEMVYANLPGAIPTVISFTPATFSNVTTGQAFRLGTLSFANGQWVGGSGDPATNYPVNLGFRISTSSATPEFNQVLDDAFTVVTNQASGDCATLAGQRDEADFIYIASASELGSMRVFDQLCKDPAATNVGTVELWGRFGSLEYVEFRNPGGSAFLDPGTGVGPIGVPEPGAWALMIAGFGLAGAGLRRRRATFV